MSKVLDYIHHNPVNGKWSLVEDYVDYPYSSARYYETGEQQEIRGGILSMTYQSLYQMTLSEGSYIACGWG